jgi:hypothetical protein
MPKHELHGTSSLAALLAMDESESRVDYDEVSGLRLDNTELLVVHCPHSIPLTLSPTHRLFL